VDTDCINLDAPMLKQLTLSFSTHADLSVSVVAPVLEKVSWECSFPRIRMTTATGAGFGPWGLMNVSLHAGESRGHRVISDVNVLSVRMSASTVCLMSCSIGL
jgi:hypothetical protein